jgi:hypothetical protein
MGEEGRSPLSLATGGKFGDERKRRVMEPECNVFWLVTIASVLHIPFRTGCGPDCYILKAREGIEEESLQVGSLRCRSKTAV